MKYLKIVNNGEIDVRLISLMGATTKANDDKLIGKFGTGLKYAITYFLRNSINFKMFTGTKEIKFEVIDKNISENVFGEIFMDGVSMNITTHYGHQWEAWEALREIWCNAKDEGGEMVLKIDDAKRETIGTEGTTTFYIEMTKEVSAVQKKWQEYFLKATPIFEDENSAIYLNTGEYLKIYKNGVLIENQETYKSLFVYDIKEAELNELRQYRGYSRVDLGKSILSSNKEVISLLMACIKDEKNKDMFEVKLDWDYLTFDKAKVKKIFSGYLFLHPDSTVPLSNKSVKVNISLFNLLKKSGLSCENIKQSYGGSYGGGGIGFNAHAEVKYKEISNDDLRTKISNIMYEYSSQLNFAIAVPTKGSFEVMVTGNNEVVFNADLDKLSDKDLKATVLVALFHANQGNLYKALKRLIKFIMGKPFFRDLLFGKDDKISIDNNDIGF